MSNIPTGYDITQECDGGYRPWQLVENVNHHGETTGGQHYAPLTCRNARSRTAALRCIRQHRQDGYCDEPARA